MLAKNQMENISLVLSGGGARGAYQIGAWSALREIGLDKRIKVITGSSIGAINGALMAQDSYELALELWDAIHPASFFDRCREKNLQPDTFAARVYFELWKDRFKHGGIRFDPGKDLIRAHVEESVIRKSSVQFGLTTYNQDLRQGVALFADQIPDGQLAEYIIASASFPLFQPHLIGGHRHIDGGVYDNFPVALALKRAPKDPVLVISISMIGSYAATFLKQRFPDVPLHVLFPSRKLGSPLHFSKNIVHKNIQIGYEDTLRLFETKALKSLLWGL